jgi:hypothetical protein
LVELQRDADRATSRSILRDLHARRMSDNPARIECRKLGGNASDEVPGPVASGEKIRHGGETLLDVLLDVLLAAPSALSRAGWNDTRKT